MCYNEGRIVTTLQRSNTNLQLNCIIYYSEGGIIPNVPSNILGQIENLLNRLKAVLPQYELDGIKNVWIVKPGAKSRGRGKSY